MKISTKGRYAVRLMLDLALHREDAPVSLGDVARRQDISEKYLEQIVTPLARSGLVRSVRGAGGGYLLTRENDGYTVGDILRPLEGDLAPVSCVGASGCCQRAERCVTTEVWDKVYRAVRDVVDSITLSDLAARYEEKERGA